MRAFLAFEVPQDIVDYLGGVIGGMRRIVDDVRWVRPEAIHITLKFFGEIEEQRVSEMRGLLAPGVEAYPPIRADLLSVDAFPTKARARVIIVRLGRGVKEIRQVFETVEEGLGKMGIERETRDFTPHLTLGRRRVPAPFRGDPPLVEKRAFDIDGLVLFKSTLMPSGAVYAPQWKITLGGKA